MNKKNCFLALLIFAIGTTTIQATPADPRIIVSGEGDATPVQSLVFTFMSDSTGGGVLSFVNDTSTNFESLDFFVNLPQGSPINCSSNAFNVCEVTSTNIPGNIANYDIGFDGPIAGGITPGEDFSINLNDTGTAVDGSGGWGANNTFTAVANLPEPATWPLLASGIALLAGFRRHGGVHLRR